jgi:type IV pilus assembly protein PilW
MNYKQSGYSLIELMIASVIGLVVLSGAVTVFSSNKASQSLTSGMSQIQENGRVALDIIANGARLTGYQGCTNGIREPKVLATNAPSIKLVSESLWGASYDGLGWSPSRPAELAQIGNMPAENTDIIYVKHGSGRATILNASMANASVNPIVLARNPDQLEAGDLVMISDCIGSDVFRATSVSAGPTNVSVGFNAVDNTQANLSRAYTVTGNSEFDPMRVMRFEANAYFVADSGRNDPSGNSITSLFVHDTTASPVGAPTELVEGVESMQILYGEKLANGSVRYLPAGDPNLNMAQVTSVQIGLLLRSIDNIASRDDTKTYMIAGQEIGPPGGSTALTHSGGKYMRAAFNTTVRLRNRTLQ